MAELLDEIIARISDLDGSKLAELEGDLDKVLNAPKWTPNDGPQTEAYLCKADILLYGGQGGGGKSDLLLGLAFNEHQRSLLVRRRYADLSALTKRAIEVNGTRKGFNGSTPPSLMTTDGRLIEFGGCANAGDEESWQGRAHDFLGLEEGAQLLESQARYLMGWVRTTAEGQRCRCVIASNPPLTDEGQWLTQMFAPWLVNTHPNPAEPGELRWYIVDQDGKDQEVDGPGEYEIDGKMHIAQSRTFIPAALDDNPYLRDTGYKAQLDSLPEPLRSALRDGNFTTGLQDNPRQIIPSAWVLAAQDRWTREPPKNAPMSCIGVDPAMGGPDETILARRYDYWFDEMLVFQGRETPMPSDTAAQVVKYRKALAQVVLDMGGGYGSGIYETLTANEIPVVGFDGSRSSGERTKDRMLGFYNLRAEAWWRFREALDPDQPQGSPIQLPPDPKLLADLVSVQFKPTTRGIQAEAKVDVIKRLGRSPDRGDAVVLAWYGGPTWVTHGQQWREFSERGNVPTVKRSYPQRRRRR